MKKDSIKILIVDDHQLVVDGLKSLLSDKDNIEVVAEANNGKEVLEVLNKISADVVLMDVEMPVMNGWDATKIIVSRYPKTKVIALSSFSEKAIVRKMITAGVSGYILKNIDKEVLIEAITTVNNGFTYYCSEISLALMKPTSEESFELQTQQPSPDLLSSRETEILKLIGKGLSTKEIGSKLFISHKTVNAHREHIMKKLNIHNVVGLVRYAINSGLID
jgi:DNA-binding NarL/FixJ family response regulator